jgi:4-amino-4-deoxy-L-arabinose transferase-like glycosyltransferase
MLWVAVANAAIARLLLRGPSWARQRSVAGIALGLALMSKGPVGLLQTPRSRLRLRDRSAARRAYRSSQIDLALSLKLLVGSGWYVYVFTHVPGRLDALGRSSWRAADRARSRGNPLSYLSLLAYMLPWTGRADSRARSGPASTRGGESSIAGRSPCCSCSCRSSVMSFFPDRKERYLLPLVAPAAILAARRDCRRCSTRRRNETSRPLVHWARLAAIAVGFPIAGATHLLKAHRRRLRGIRPCSPRARRSSPPC